MPDTNKERIVTYFTKFSQPTGAIDRLTSMQKTAILFPEMGIKIPAPNVWKSMPIGLKAKYSGKVLHETNIWISRLIFQKIEEQQIDIFGIPFDLSHSGIIHESKPGVTRSFIAFDPETGRMRYRDTKNEQVGKMIYALVVTSCACIYELDTVNLS
jgi:hypothetical protein